ncbi:hypothetical protein Dsin_030104 [Dipteronia sinensis]|uniref:Uncharacterized protein n=1 Tax=Dipteronia sinensis TaxID=43782 RepID=A0AAD9ZJB9_9ROSI|nr:hypothetical protein Dsin_030104 [Dipteronia sinensis]
MGCASHPLVIYKKKAMTTDKESKVRSVDYRLVNALGGRFLCKGIIVDMLIRRLLFVYASNLDEERVALWEFIITNQRKFSAPWIVRGDFNVVLNVVEKLVEPPIPLYIRHFRKFIDDAKFINIPMLGFPFTWSDAKEVVS